MNIITTDDRHATRWARCWFACALL